MPPKREGTERGVPCGSPMRPCCRNSLIRVERAGEPSRLPPLRAACRCVLDLQWYLPVAAQEHLFIVRPDAVCRSAPPDPIHIALRHRRTPVRSADHRIRRRHGERKLPRSVWSPARRRYDIEPWHLLIAANLCNDAPMPYMQRPTWSGVATPRN